MALEPTDVAYYNSARRRIQQTFDYGSDQQKLNRSVSKAQYGWRKHDLTKQFAQARERFGQPYAARGLFRSGIYQNALGNFRADRAQGLSRLATTRGWETTGEGTEKWHTGRAYNEAMLDLDEQKRARLEAIASSLQGYTA